MSCASGGCYSALSGGNLVKAVAEDRLYLFDFSAFPEIRAGDTLSTCSAPAVSGLTYGTPAVLAVTTGGIAAGKGVSLRISGGMANTSYEVEVRGVTAGGSTLVVRGGLQVL